jgi:nitrate/nitrite-specific signal transduction histidine kinase
VARKSIRIPRFVTLRTRLALSFIAIATLLIGLILVVIYFNFINLLHADTKANDILMVERGLRVQFFSFFLLSLPIVGLAAWLIGDRVAKPIKLLANVTAQIAQGDNGYRPEINTKVSEIAQLRTSFYSMADQTQSLISNLEKHVSERTQEIESRSTK